MSRLRRTACGEMKTEDAVPADELLRLEREEVIEKIIPVRNFAGYPGVKI